MQKMINRFEDMEIWKRSSRLVVELYKLTMSGNFEKDWGLRDQIRRSAVSIPSNIAEGFDRESKAEFRRFLFIARGSCAELKTQLYITQALEYSNKAIIESHIKECQELSSMIQGMINHLNKK